MPGVFLILGGWGGDEYDKNKKRIKINDVRWVVVVGIWRWRGRRTNSSCEESGLPQVAASQLPTIKYFVVQPMLLEGF